MTLEYEAFSWVKMIASAHEVDDLDRRILSHLKVDGRAPLAKIAASLHVSRGTVQNRIDRLVENGVILGFTVRTLEHVKDDRVNAIVMIEVNGKYADNVVRRLRGFPEIRGIHTTNGKWDFVAMISTENLGGFDSVLRKIRMIDGVSNSETSILLTEYHT